MEQSGAGLGKACDPRGYAGTDGVVCVCMSVCVCVSRGMWEVWARVHLESHFVGSRSILG